MARAMAFLLSCLLGTGVGAVAACGPHINGEAVYGLSGHITGTVSGGITVVLDIGRVTTTDRGGSYSFSTIYYGSDTVTPSLSGYTFTPPSKTVSTGSTDPTDGDFTSGLGNPDACPSGYEGLLNGQYAFLLRGADANGGVARAGSFIANGAGGVSWGVEDRISLGGGPLSVSVMPSGSSYSLGADQRGCLTLEDSSGTSSVFRFSVGGVAPSVSGVASPSVAFTGRLIEFDTTDSGSRAEGILRRQDGTGFATMSLSGTYVAALTGTDVGGGRHVTAGVVTAAGGAFSQGMFDTNASGTLAPTAMGVGGTYSLASTGRGVASLGGQSYVLYAVSSTEFIAISSSVPSASAPVLGGELFRQAPTSFDNTSLNATAIVSQSGVASGSDGAKASIGAFTPDGKGNFSWVVDENDSGTFAPLAASSGTYSIAYNGRATAVVGSRPTLLYLFDVNHAVVLSGDAEASFGLLEPQDPSPYAYYSLNFSGRFVEGTEGAAPESRPIHCGALWFDGKSNYTGSVDESTPLALTPNLLSTPGNGFSFTQGMVAGRGTLDSHTPPSTIAYFVQYGRMVYLDTQARWPVLTFIDG
jgi:hypothetical protein